MKDLGLIYLLKKNGDDFNSFSAMKYRKNGELNLHVYHNGPWRHAGYLELDDHDFLICEEEYKAIRTLDVATFEKLLTLEDKSLIDSLYEEKYIKVIPGYFSIKLLLKAIEKYDELCDEQKTKYGVLINYILCGRMFRAKVDCSFLFNPLGNDRDSIIWDYGNLCAKDPLKDKKDELKKIKESILSFKEEAANIDAYYQDESIFPYSEKK